jgi:hypothetical protein
VTTRDARIAAIAASVERMLMEFEGAVRDTANGYPAVTAIARRDIARQRIIGYVEGVASVSLPWDGWDDAGGRDG